MSRDLRYALINICSGSAATVVRQQGVVGDNSSFETFRVLHQWFLLPVKEYRLLDHIVETKVWGAKLRGEFSTLGIWGSTVWARQWPSARYSQNCNPTQWNGSTTTASTSESRTSHKTRQWEVLSLNTTGQLQHWVSWSWCTPQTGRTMVHRQWK